MTSRRAQPPWLKRLYLPAYNTVEAARLAKTRPQTVAYWHYGTGTKVGPALKEKERGAPLSYLQLVEVAFVASFRKRGVSLQRIRRAREYVAKRFQVEFPFAHFRFYTEGIHVLLDLTEHETEFKDLIAADEAGQMAWRDTLAERFAEFDYDENLELALPWHPRGKSVPIIVDPRISFGAPVVERIGVPTWVLRGRIEAGETPEEIEEEFAVRPSELKHALEFEELQFAA